jgi:hypothetical protein
VQLLSSLMTVLSTILIERGYQTQVNLCYHHVHVCLSPVQLLSEPAEIWYEHHTALDQPTFVPFNLLPPIIPNGGCVNL